jgi:outer membrane protein assembly factor BamB
VLDSLDIFKMQNDGTYVWKAAATTFEIATSKIEKLASIAPGDYMIFSQTTGKKTVIPLDAT